MTTIGQYTDAETERANCGRHPNLQTLSPSPTAIHRQPTIMLECPLVMT